MTTVISRFTSNVCYAACLAALLASAGCGQPSAQKLTATPSAAFDRVIKDKVLKVGYINYPPSLIKDPKGSAITGIVHDVLKEVGRLTNLKVEFVEEVNWQTMIEAVNSQRVDIICTGLWPNSTRAPLADFTDAVYYSPIRAYVKAGDRSFDGDLSRANQPEIRIAGIDGEMSAIVAKSDFPKAALSALPLNTDVSQLLLEVASGKANIAFVEPATARAFLDRNPDAIREVGGVQPVRVFPNVMMVAKGEFKLVSMLNVSLAELANNGFTDRVVEKYAASKDLFFLRSLPYRSLQP